MGMILRIASSRIVGQGDIVGRSGYFSLNLSANSVMRGRLDARRTLKSLVADLRFYTSYEKYMLQALRMQAFDFLLKPVSKDDLLLAMNRYYLNKKNTKLPPVLPPHYPIDKPLLITTITNDKVILRPQNIGYFRYNSERKLWEIILDDFRHVILKHNTTAEVILNYGAEFIQIHKTYIININYLSMIQDSTCIMLYPFNTVTELKVSKIYKKKLLDKFYNL